MFILFLVPELDTALLLASKEAKEQKVANMNMGIGNLQNNMMGKGDSSDSK